MATGKSLAIAQPALRLGLCAMPKRDCREGQRSNQSRIVSLLDTSFLVLAAALDEQKMHGAEAGTIGVRVSLLRIKGVYHMSFFPSCSSSIHKGKEHA